MTRASRPQVSVLGRGRTEQPASRPVHTTVAAGCRLSGRRRCRRVARGQRTWHQIGTVRRAQPSGLSSQTFCAGAAQQHLISGRHRVVLTATDTAGHQSSEVVVIFDVDRN